MTATTMTDLTIAMAQINPLLGDISGNTDLIIEYAKRAKAELNADIIVFPELCLTGYPPEDLLLRPELHRRVETALSTLGDQIKNIHLIIGHPQQQNESIYNAASIIYNGNTIGTYYKQHLPNYSVFDEKRYFQTGNQACIVTIKNTVIGLVICEDLWQPGPLRQAAKAGAELMLCINASPFHIMKMAEREDNLRTRQEEEAALPIIYVNCVGGQDELVFDGGSFVMDATGNIIHREPLYTTSLSNVSVKKNKTLTIQPGTIEPFPIDEAIIYNTLVLGTRDYLLKNGFKTALIGISGGIDSALTATIAADAIGANHVHCVYMPSRYSADISREDAIALIKNLGSPFHEISIEPVFESFLSSLAAEFANTSSNATEENIQARCRGILLMALSNKFGHLVLTTGNKSEMAVGYATLYGDMAGGFAVLKDVSKTLVYQLSNYRNTINHVIPERIITRPPSAELRAEQTDQDTLPSYDSLDPVMALYVEENFSIEDIIEQGFSENLVRQVVDLIDRNEYKRRQAPPGIRISHRAFGRDWRYPITSGYYTRKFTLES